MSTWTNAAWVALATVTLLSILSMRGTIRILGRGVDNGWDNAVGYVAVSVMLGLARGYLSRHSQLALVLSPLCLWVGQTVAIKIIYELRTFHAWLVGLVHTLATAAIVSAVGFATALVAAYILYGKIISDPMFLVRLLLRWIGIEI